jgi:hypothetical protein
MLHAGTNVHIKMKDKKGKEQISATAQVVDGEAIMPRTVFNPTVITLTFLRVYSCLH